MKVVVVEELFSRYRRISLPCTVDVHDFSRGQAIREKVTSDLFEQNHPEKEVKHLIPADPSYERLSWYLQLQKSAEFCPGY